MAYTNFTKSNLTVNKTINPNGELTLEVTYLGKTQRQILPAVEYPALLMFDVNTLNFRLIPISSLDINKTDLFIDIIKNL